jgi:transcriptional regulator with XRE-family HTH domain
MSDKSTHRKPGEQDSNSGNGETEPHAELAELAALARISSSQPLSDIPATVAPEIRDFAETLRMLFGALGMSLNRLAALLHSDPGTVSRYLSGKRIPPPDFVDSLCKAVYDVKGSLVTPQVQELVHEQFLAALREHNPARYEVQRLTDLLQVAAQEKRQYQITVDALEEAIASRSDKIYALELEGRQLRSAWARTEGLLGEERKQRAHLQETIDSLYTQVSFFKEQLMSAQGRAAEAEGRCRELEARLDAAGALLQDEDQQTAAPQVTAFNDTWPDWFQSYVGMEGAAQSIQVYETHFIPGLLQTEEYAAAVISLGDFPREQAERLVALRMERQRGFRDGKLKLRVLLDETALRRPVAGINVQLEQLRHLREACAGPTLTLQILPPQAGGDSAPSGFSILRFAERDQPDVVYVENLTSALYLDKQDDVGRYLFAAERLSLVAREPQNSPEIIDRIIADLETADGR